MSEMKRAFWVTWFDYPEVQEGEGLHLRLCRPWVMAEPGTYAFL